MKKIYEDEEILIVDTGDYAKAFPVRIFYERIEMTATLYSYSGDGNVSIVGGALPHHIEKLARTKILIYAYKSGFLNDRIKKLEDYKKRYPEPLESIGLDIINRDIKCTEDLIVKIKKDYLQEVS